MSNSLFNVSPVKFLNCIQDNFYTFTSKMYKGEEQQRQQQHAVTLQVTVSPETTEPSSYHQPLTLPIDIPGSYSHSAFDNEGKIESNFLYMTNT